MQRAAMEYWLKLGLLIHDNSQKSADRYLKNYLNHPEFDNSKTYPESIIKDVSQDILPYSSEAVDYYQSLIK